MSFELENSSNSEEEELDFHPPKDKDEEKELEKRKQTKLSVRNIIWHLKEGNEGKILWEEVCEILFSNGKKLFTEYIKHVWNLNKTKQENAKSKD